MKGILTYYYSFNYHGETEIRDDKPVCGVDVGIALHLSKDGKEFLFDSDNPQEPFFGLLTLLLDDVRIEDGEVKFDFFEDDANRACEKLGLDDLSVELADLSFIVTENEESATAFSLPADTEAVKAFIREHAAAFEPGGENTSYAIR